MRLTQSPSLSLLTSFSYYTFEQLKTQDCGRERALLLCSGDLETDAHNKSIRFLCQDLKGCEPFKLLIVDAQKMSVFFASNGLRHQHQGGEGWTAAGELRECLWNE